MTFQQILDVITTILGNFGSTTGGGNGSGILYTVWAYLHLLHPNNHAFFDSTYILRFFVLLAFIPLGLSLFKRLVKS